MTEGVAELSPVVVEKEEPSTFADILPFSVANFESQPYQHRNRPKLGQALSRMEGQSNHNQAW